MQKKNGKKDEKEYICQQGGSIWWMPIKWSISIIWKNENHVANQPSYVNLLKSIAPFKHAVTDVVTNGHATVSTTRFQGTLFMYFEVF